MNDLTAQIGQFRARLLQDALQEATAEYWLRRAAVWENARPKRGDYHGAATREQLRSADARCAMVAENCRRHAALLREGLPPAYLEEIAEVLVELVDHGTLLDVLTEVRTLSEVAA